MERVDINFQFQPKQYELLYNYERIPQTIFGFGGSRGGAKSHLGRNLILWRRWKYANTNGYIIRKTIDDIRDNHIRPMFLEHPYLRDYYNKQEKILLLPNGSFIRFISSDNHDDIFKLIGKEAADIFLDQAEQFDQEQIEFLTTINRCVTNLDITPKMLLTFNPGNIGHQYLRRIFVKQNYDKNENPNDYYFLRAYGWDNYKWVEKYLVQNNISTSKYYGFTDDERFKVFIEHSDYGSKLNALPEAQRKAQLFGDFDVFEGQFFWMWRENIHLIPPINYDKSLGWKLLGGLDYGQRTVLEVAGRDYAGNVLFFAEHFTEQMTPKDRANSMCDYLIEKKLFKLDIVYDTNMDIDLSKYYPTEDVPINVFKNICEVRMKENKPNFHVVSKSTTDNRGYRAICNEAFINGLDPGKDAKPKIRITRECKQLVETIPNFISDPNSMEGLDFDKSIGIQDPYDAAKMLYMELRKPSTPPKSVPHWVLELQKEKQEKEGWSLGK